MADICSERVFANNFQFRALPISAMPLLFYSLYIIINCIILRADGDFMKIKEDFLLRKVADSYVVVPVNNLTLDFNGIINLNETGAFLFELLQKGADREELVQKMLDEYEVTRDKAENDIDIFIKKVKDADILE